MYDVVEVKYLRKYTLEVAFENGERGEIDLKDYAQKGGVFEPFMDVEYFKRVSVNKDLGTICWPNGADIAPETLYRFVKEKVH